MYSKFKKYMGTTETTLGIVSESCKLDESDERLCGNVNVL